MENKQAKNEKTESGDILQVATDYKPIVVDENGREILCESEKEAIFLSYLIKIWNKVHKINN